VIQQVSVLEIPKPLGDNVNDVVNTVLLIDWLFFIIMKLN